MLKKINNYPKYLIEKEGKVWSTKTNKYLKSFLRTGYPSVWLSNKTGYKYKRIHRLILETFIGPCPNNMMCRHLDGNRLNCNLSNLKWGTMSENQIDRGVHGTSNLGKSYNQGSAHPSSKLREIDVRDIMYLYKTRLFTLKDLAYLYSVYYTTIQKIVNKLTWKHLWKENL